MVSGGCLGGDAWGSLGQIATGGLIFWLVGDTRGSLEQSHFRGHFPRLGHVPVEDALLGSLVLAGLLAHPGQSLFVDRPAGEALGGEEFEGFGQGDQAPELLGQGHQALVDDAPGLGVQGQVELAFLRPDGSTLEVSR